MGSPWGCHTNIVICTLLTRVCAALCLLNPKAHTYAQIHVKTRGASEWARRKKYEWNWFFFSPILPSFSPFQILCNSNASSSEGASIRSARVTNPHRFRRSGVPSSSAVKEVASRSASQIHAEMARLFMGLFTSTCLVCVHFYVWFRTFDNDLRTNKSFEICRNFICF